VFRWFQLMHQSVWLQHSELYAEAQAHKHRVAEIESGHNQRYETQNQFLSMQVANKSDAAAADRNCRQLKLVQYVATC
jgi:hypothetical protein